MSNVYISVVVLAVYIAVCVACKLRLDQLDRRAAHKRRIRQIKAYTVRKPDTVYSNVYPLDTYSRKVNEAA